MSPQFRKKRDSPPNPQTYLTLATRLRHYADRLEERAKAETPQEQRVLGNLLRAITWAAKSVRARHLKYQLISKGDRR